MTYVLSLFTGYGGLDLALEIAGVSVSPLCYVERSIQAAALLADRIEKGALAYAPQWSDIRSFNGAPYRGKVDILTAGYPCQDFSLAGKRAGLSGRRGKCWEQVRRIIGICEPRLCFLENVPGHLTCGFERVLLDLAECGYDAGWTVISTREVGNSQIRKRLFCVAYRQDTDRRAGESTEQGEMRERWGGFTGGGCGMADPRRRQLPNEGRGTERRNGAGSAMPLFPPGPGDVDAWRRILAERPDLAPAIEPEVCDVAHGTPGRVDQLRMLGNGVEPLQAALAFVEICRAEGIVIKEEITKPGTVPADNSHSVG